MTAETDRNAQLRIRLEGVPRAELSDNLGGSGCVGQAPGRVVVSCLNQYPESDLKNHRTQALTVLLLRAGIMQLIL